MGFKYKNMNILFISRRYNMSASKDMIFSSEAATIHEVLELIGMAYFMDLKTEKK